jgi:hypothetical protein
MERIIRYGYKFLVVAVMGMTFACGNAETGDDAGESNHEDAKAEYKGQGSDDVTRQSENGSNDAEQGDEPGVNRTNTDSTQVTPRMQRKQ